MAAPYKMEASGDRLTGKKPTTALTGGSSYVTFGVPKPASQAQPSYSERKFARKMAPPKGEKPMDVRIEIKVFQCPFDKPNTVVFVGASLSFFPNICHK